MTLLENFINIKKLEDANNRLLKAQEWLNRVRGSKYTQSEHRAVEALKRARNDILKCEIEMKGE